LDEVKTHISIGQKYLESLQKSLKQKNFYKVANDYTFKLGSYLEDIEELCKQSEKF
jgi:hypothetical protein